MHQTSSQSTKCQSFHWMFFFCRTVIWSEENSCPLRLVVHSPPLHWLSHGQVVPVVEFEQMTCFSTLLVVFDLTVVNWDLLHCNFLPKQCRDTHDFL